MLGWIFYVTEKSTEENGDISDIVPNTSTSFSEEKGSELYTSIKLKYLSETVNESTYYMYSVIVTYVNIYFTRNFLCLWLTGNSSVGNLFHSAGQIGKAVGSLVEVMTEDGEPEED